MSSQFISGGEIVLLRDVHKGAPGLRTSLRFRANQVVYVGVVYYPGMELTHKPETEWVFWTDSDVDTGIIFNPDEVGEFRIHERYFPGWLPVLDRLKADLPFTVSMIRADGSIEPKYPIPNSAPAPAAETTREEPLAPIETNLSGFTENEIGMSEMIVERCAGQLPEDAKALLLHHLRTFAGTVAARHYIYGTVDARKTGGETNVATGDINIDEAAFLMKNVADRLDVLADGLDRERPGAGARIFTETAYLHNAVKEIQTTNQEYKAALAAKRKGTGTRGME